MTEQTGDGICAACKYHIGPQSHLMRDGLRLYTCRMSGDIGARVMGAVVAERQRQDVLWGPVQDLPHTAAIWYGILGEEVGEAAKAMNQGHDAELVDEIVQLAAVALSWLEHIEYWAEMAHNTDNEERGGA